MLPLDNELKTDKFKYFKIITTETNYWYLKLEFQCETEIFFSPLRHRLNFGSKDIV